MVGLALCYGKEGFSSWICGLKQTRLRIFRLAFLRIVNTLRFGKSFFFFVLELEMINVVVNVHIMACLSVRRNAYHPVGEPSVRFTTF
jgi:hypothetical protein